MGRWSGTKKNPSSQSESMFERFKKLDTKGQSMQDDESNTSEKLIVAAHQHPISCIRVYSKKNNNVSMISTCALDGRMFLWDISEKSENFNCRVSVSKLVNNAKETTG